MLINKCNDWNNNSKCFIYHLSINRFPKSKKNRE